MRKYELRVYTLDSEAALEQYATVNYPRHLDSFPKFGIRPEGFFRPAQASEPKLYVLVSFDDGADPAQVGAEYMASAELARDLEGFDHRTHIVGVDSIGLVPTPGSPLS
jgi:NIPSNAP